MSDEQPSEDNGQVPFDQNPQSAQQPEQPNPYVQPQSPDGANAPVYGSPAPGAPAYGAPAYGAPEGAPAYGAPAYGAPAYGAPDAAGNPLPPAYGQPQAPTEGGAPAYGVPAYGAPAYGAPDASAAPAAPAYGQPVEASNEAAAPNDAASEESGAPDASNAPSDPATGTDGAPAAPGTPTPGAPAYGAPVNPGAPVAPGYPAPGTPGAPGVPGAYGAPGAPGGYPAPAPQKKGLSKGALIGIIAGAIAAVVAIILIVVFVVVKPGSLTSDDYLDGQTQTGKISTKYYSASSAVSDALSASYGSNTFDKQDAERVKKKVKAYDEANAAFGELKIAKKDDNVKKAYDAYMKKAKKFSTLANSLADTAVPLNAAAKACDDTPSSTMYDDDFYNSYETYINGCTTALGDLSGSKVKAISEYATTLKDYMTKVGDIISQMKALGNPNDIDYDSDQYKQLRDLSQQFYDLDSPYDAGTDMSKELNDLEEESNPSDALKDLDEAVKDGFDAKMN